LDVKLGVEIYRPTANGTVGGELGKEDVASQ
jgi:hypothetical protein